MSGLQNIATSVGTQGSLPPGIHPLGAGKAGTGSKIPLPASKGITAEQCLSDINQWKRHKDTLHLSSCLPHPAVRTSPSYLALGINAIIFLCLLQLAQHH